MMLDGFLNISKKEWIAFETNRNPSLMASHGSLSPSLETVLQMCNGPPCHESLTLFSGPCRSGTEEMFFDPRDGTWALKIGIWYPKIHGIYPLVNMQKTMGNHHFWWVNPLQNLQMAIFNSHVCLPEGIISFCYDIAILRYTLFDVSLSRRTRRSYYPTWGCSWGDIGYNIV